MKQLLKKLKRPSLKASLFFYVCQTLVLSFTLVQSALALEAPVYPGLIDERDDVLEVFFPSSREFYKATPEDRRYLLKRHLNFRFKSEDDKFEYYESGNATFRFFKRPEPKLNFVTQIVIPEVPALKWAGVLEFVGDQSYPAKPNCSEASFGIEDYKRILSSPKVRTKQDFLRQLPSDVLQKFTFITKSESLQRHGVTEMRPRVMRFRTDGKFIMTYSTVKNQNLPDTIEAIYFDDATRRYNFVHTEFLSEDQIKNGVHVKSTLNPKSCFACHGGIDPRPNWNQYEKWDGTYGRFDDLMGELSGESHYSHYAKMRSELKGTAELDTLPWPDARSGAIQDYPYITVHKLQNYNSRPNAHFTIIGARLNSQRLARKMSEYPNYQKVKWSLLAHSIGCEGFGQTDSPNPILDKLLKANKDKIAEYGGEFNVYKSSKTSSAFLYRFGISLGFKSTDWSLRFNKKPEDKFESFNTAQWEMRDMIESVFFRDLVNEEPRLAPYDVRYSLMSNMFGPHFTCVDDVADRLWLTKKTKPQICKILIEKSNEEIKSIKMEEIMKTNSWKSQVWDGPVERNYEDGSLENGKKILTQTCGQCHNGDGSVPFAFSQQHYIQQLMSSQAASGYKMVIESAIKRCRMPLPIAGDCLSEKESEAVKFYLDSLSK